ncbi:uncharacterized protein LOC106661713 isoform X2 [Cimex lectularius]|uniref:TNFR-Cys domain-containing protein n=1 Tax=Cimex lectularius TaxID=79782 RepID=A0A8I6R7S2_CIMLE|nr:uncharacterized protein LOC106661713 isoform X2 [Cimex lectularius]
MFCIKIYRLFFFLAFMKVVKSLSGEEFKCGSSLDCPKGTYCYKENALYKCAPCSNCIRFFRKNSTIDDCPQRPEQCGECIAGYHSPKLIDGSEPNTCISISSEIIQPMEDINKSLPPDIQTEKGFGNPYLWVALLGIICIVSLAVAAFYARRKCNRCNTKGSMPIISETERFCISPSAPPPPYHTASEHTSHNIEHEAKPISNLPFSSDIEINTTGGVRHQIDCEFDKRQKANCYKFPYYVNEGSLAPEQGEHIMAAPREEEHLPETFDDTTQPSTWRPVAEHLNKARRKEYHGGELNTKILSTDIGDETEQQEEGENPAGNSGCEEIRQFAMISAERPNISSSPDISSSSNNTTNMGVQNFSTEPKHKKRRTGEYSEMNSFNLNIFINNSNANVNENNSNM